MSARATGVVTGGYERGDTTRVHRGELAKSNRMRPSDPSRDPDTWTGQVCKSHRRLCHRHILSLALLPSD
jgi:hypothetical protein